MLKTTIPKAVDLNQILGANMTATLKLIIANKITACALPITGISTKLAINPPAIEPKVFPK